MRIPSLLFCWTPMASEPNKDLKVSCGYISLLQRPSQKLPVDTIELPSLMELILWLIYIIGTKSCSYRPIITCLVHENNYYNNFLLAWKYINKNLKMFYYNSLAKKEKENPFINFLFGGSTNLLFGRLRIPLLVII